MKSKIDIKFRKERIGPEQELINEFLKCHKEFFLEKKLEVTPLFEPYAEIGIPDILLIFWDKSLCESWNPQRNKLTKTDIKIVHYISTFGRKGICKSDISIFLNFEPKKLNQSLDRLSNADLIEDLHKKVKIKKIKEIFFIRKIISIEAKISNWKSAINQAIVNENFASHSYVLLPEKSVSSKVLSSFAGRIGLLTNDGEKNLLRKEAQQTKIPGSYFSWVLNEYLGSQYNLNGCV